MQHKRMDGRIFLIVLSPGSFPVCRWEIIGTRSEIMDVTTSARLVPHLPGDSFAPCLRIQGVAYRDADGGLATNGQTPYLMQVSSLPPSPIR